MPVSQDLVEAIERVLIRSGGITTRAVTEVHPETRGLTVSQYRGLVLIATSPDGLRVGELARLARTSSQTATRLAQRLERRGLVIIERGSEEDRRASIVRATASGTRVWSDICARRRRHIARALEAVELPDDAETTIDAVATAFARYGG